MQDTMEIGNEQSGIFLHVNLRAMRKRLQLSQEELASRVGLNRGNIASYEKGTAEPKICNLLRLSKFFKISVLDLTQKDLSNGDTVEIASENYERISTAEQELIKQFMKRTEELEAVIQSLHTCSHFKARTIGELPKDMQILMFNFEQLYDASQNLMRNHKALLDFIRCKIK